MAFENISDEAWQDDLDLKLFAAIRFSNTSVVGFIRRVAATRGLLHGRRDRGVRHPAVGVDQVEIVLR